MMVEAVSLEACGGECAEAPLSPIGTEAVASSCATGQGLLNMGDGKRATASQTAA